MNGRNTPPLDLTGEVPDWLKEALQEAVGLPHPDTTEYREADEAFLAKCEQAGRATWARIHATAAPLPDHGAASKTTVGIIPKTRRISSHIGWWSMLPLRTSIVAALVVLFCVGTLSSVVLFRHPEAVRITSDLGLNKDPAVSLESGYLAYSSDRGGEGHLSIWVEDLATSTPLRLTNNEADDSSPSISQGWVAFRSERAGGGIYKIPAAGGAEQLVVAHGYGPRISPDGRWIAYWVGDHFTEPGEIFILPMMGGTPVNLCAKCAYAKYPVWSADSRSILFRGALKLPDGQHGNGDWFVERLDFGRPKGDPVQTMARRLLDQEGIRANTAMPIPEAWHEDDVFFTTRVSPSNAWALRLDPGTLVATGSPINLTFGTGDIENLAVDRNGSAYFAGLSSTTNVFAIPMDSNNGKPLGPLVRLTAEAANNLYPSLSADGLKVAFSSDRRRERGIWILDLATGAYKFLSASASVYDSPKISPNGSFVAYTSPTETQRDWTLKLVPTDGLHQPVAVLEAGNAGPPKGWSGDGSMLLFETKSIDPEKRFGAGILHVSTRTVCTFQHPALAVFPNSFSPDSRWVAFHTRDRSGRRMLWIGELTNGCWPAEKDWISAISEPSGSDREAQWSPDGHTLYFLSERDGVRCIWAQRLDPPSHHPIGRPFSIQHFHGPSASLLNEQGPGAVGLTVLPSKVVISVKTTTGNIWAMPPTDKGLARIFHLSNTLLTRRATTDAQP